MLRTRDDQQMMTAEELRLRLQKRRRLLLLLGLALVLGLAGFVAARPTRDAIKGWQARRHATKAFAFIEQAEWNDARNEALAAYQLSSVEPQAIRAVARFLSRTRQQQALEFWDQLAQLQPLTRGDLRDETAVALIGGELERAAAVVDQLLAHDGKGAAPQDWLLAAQLRLQQGAADKALDSLGKLFALPNVTAREQFQAALLQLQVARTGDAETDTRNQTEAWKRLTRLAQGDDAVALDSLVVLAQRQLTQKPLEATGPAADSDANLSTGDMLASTSEIPPTEELVRRLQNHPLAKAPQKLLAIDLQIQAQPTEREALTSKAIADWKDADASQLAVLATWLNGKGEYQRNLDEIPLERAVQSRDLFLQHMDALGALGHWDEIDGLLDSERYPLEPVIQRMYLARANAQLGQDAASKNNWQRALEAAAGDAGKLMTLAEYAEKNGATEVAASAYTQVTAATPKLRSAWQGKLRTTYASHDTKHIHDVLAERLKLWPNDTAIQNDEAYTRLLLLDTVEAASDVSAELNSIEKLAEELVRREPTSLPHRTLLALARMRQDRPVAALQVYDGIQVAQNALTPSALAVHAAVLAANDQRDAARKEIAPVSSDRLLPEEQALIANLRE